MSSAEAAIAQKAREVPPGSFRHTVLLSAKRFKATWVELGKLLVRVRDEGTFGEWGYDSFEVYCLRELHLKKQTVLKLTRSFSFLKKHEPKELGSEDIAERAPAFEVVEVLAEAEERGQLSAAEYRSVRDSIWDQERPAAEVKRELVERFPRPPPEPPGESILVRRMAGAARKLAADLVACRKVPRAVGERASALAEDLEELASRAE